MATGEWARQCARCRKTTTDWEIVMTLPNFQNATLCWQCARAERDLQQEKAE